MREMKRTRKERTEREKFDKAVILDECVEVKNESLGSKKHSPHLLRESQLRFGEITLHTVVPPPL